MRRSKLLTVLVAAALGVSMVGCGSSGGSSGRKRFKPVQWQIRISHYAGLTVSRQTAQQALLTQTALTFQQQIHIM